MNMIMDAYLKRCLTAPPEKKKIITEIAEEKKRKEH